MEEGATISGIADRLGITGGTAKAHLVRTYRKMGVHNSTQAAVKWVREQEMVQNRTRRPGRIAPVIMLTPKIAPRKLVGSRTI